MTTSPDIHKAAAALGRKGGKSTSEAKQAASRENGKRGGRPRKVEPKYSAGDEVTIITHDDPDYGKTFTVTGLSPSTKVKRSNGQWRYRLSNGAYLNENCLERAQ